jgi:hypothetical protein
MKLFQILTLFFLSLNTGLAAQSKGAIDWDYEIDLLGRELADRHPDLFFRTDSTSFVHEMKEVAEAAPGLSLFEVSVRLQQVIAAQGDAHTQINYHFQINKSMILPISTYWFEDGIYIIKAEQAYKALLGKRLMAINNIALEEVIDSLSTLVVIDNPSFLKNQVPRMLTWSQLLEYFGFSRNGTYTLSVADQSGKEEETHITLPTETGDMRSIKPAKIPLGWQDQSTYFHHRYLESEKLLYIQYNRCWSREVEENFGSGASALFMPSFKEFEKEVFQVLKKKEVDKLVFDMRFNGGGNSRQGSDFIEKICKNKALSEAGIFVLIGRKTFSSAIINTVDFMKGAEVLLVGELTGGKPNHFGEVKRFVLPESKLIVSYSSKYFSLVEGDPPAIVPNEMAPLYFDQFMNGVDPAMEVVRRSDMP